MQEDSSAYLRWEADEHRHVEHGSDWYWALGVIAVATSLTAVLLGDVLFAVLIVLAAITMGLIAQRPPRRIMFEISKDGIRTGETLHSYTECLSFWVDEDGDETLLLVDTTKPLSPNLVVPIGAIAADDVRTLLRPHIEEIPMKEPFSHKLLEFFGF